MCTSQNSSLTSEPHFGAHVEISVRNRPIVPILSRIFSSMSNYIDSPENHASKTIIFLPGTIGGRLAVGGPSLAQYCGGPIRCAIVRLIKNPNVSSES